jgi:hypothetical protein
MSEQQPQVQMQQVEFVMAKTPEQIAQEAAEAALAAKVKRFGIELAKVCRNCEDSDDVGTPGNPRIDHYTTKLEFDGEIWLFSNDGATRSTLRQSRQPAGRHIVIHSGNYNVAAEGAEEDYEYLEGYDGLNVTDLFSVGSKSDVSKFIMACIRRDDNDTRAFMGFVMSYGKYEVQWPTGHQAVNLIDLFILLSAVKTEKSMVRLQDGNVGILTSLAYNEASVFEPEHISFNLRRTLAIGNGVAEASTNGYVTQTKNTEGNLEIRPATVQEIETAVEIGRARFELASGSGGEGHNHVMFNGTSFTPDWRGRPVPQVTKSRVVIDAEGLRLLDQHKLQGLFNMMRLGVDLDRKRDEKAKAPTEQDLAMLEPVVVFFNLDKCDWQLGYLKDVALIKFRENAFDRLVLDSHRKRLVESLVIYTNSGTQRSVDLIDGKGGGAIFLLDGPPGTGKTLTAEATAEKLERPLYKVGLGELGTNAERMEGKLDQVLNIARRWNAVLLLDEADVFLEKRSTENLTRNAMVAVFLRLMEYYNGILFLTTNRGDNFDPAVLSRVTLALHFKKPTHEGRTTIWRNLLENAEINVTDKELSNLADLDINGREIKNAINSSQALANADGTVVTYNHIRELTDAQALFAQEVKRDDEESTDVSMITKLVGALMKLIK